jgi:corrinoid protein of di/trimethylamine methyltransferase
MEIFVMSETKILDALAKAVIDGNDEAARKAAAEAINENVDPIKAIKEGLAKGMSVIGEKFHKFEVFLPHVMLAADAMKEAASLLEKNIGVERKAEITHGKVVIGTVFGDIHDIGKNLLATLLSVEGFEVYDLGSDVPVKMFLNKAKDVEADIIAMSCLMSPSMFYQKDLIEYLRDKGTRSKYYVIIGGGPIHAEWTKKICADGYGRYADDGVNICKQFMKENMDKPLKEPIIKS